MRHLYPNYPAALPRFISRRAALMAVIFAFLLGCGSDADSNKASNDYRGDNNIVDEPGPDAGGFEDTGADNGEPGVDDAGNEYDASQSADASNDFDNESGYDPDLEPTEPPPEECP